MVVWGRGGPPDPGVGKDTARNVWFLGLACLKSPLLQLGIQAPSLL